MPDRLDWTVELVSVLIEIAPARIPKAVLREEVRRAQFNARNVLEVARDQGRRLIIIGGTSRRVGVSPSVGGFGASLWTS